jgi:tRNA pseudouridine55 synthase
MQTPTRKAEYRDVHGILLLDKPLGLSSNQALQKARHLLRAKKAGHTGSLDPLATGLLPICFGEATKIAGYLLGSRKAYVAQCRLGATTTTDDAEGEVVRTRVVPELDDAQIEAALAGLRGRIVQIPPAYSAIKQGGVPLYKRARRGEEVEVPSRQVEVYAFDLLERRGDLLTLHVECASGTYVRSLARDLGEKLGCGAHLTALRRDWVEPFKQPAMHTLAELAQALGDGVELDSLLLPLESGLQMMSRFELDEIQEARLRHGQALHIDGAVATDQACAFGRGGRPVALIAIDAVGAVRILRGFASQSD